MTVCVVGSGAREHALAHVLSRTEDVVVTPGNPGIGGMSPEGFSISSVATSPLEIEADLFVIGPEVPLVDGLGDQLRAAGRLVFGPSADGAQLEGSKAFMKTLSADAGVPTARFCVVDELEDGIAFLKTLPGPYVIKTDGLAAGKGVLVTADFDEAVRDLKDKLSGSSFGDAGRRVVLEEGLVGTEVSLLVLCDGKRVMALPAARDYKRVGVGDTGPNTGGMGAFSSAEVADDETIQEIMDIIVAPTLKELQRRGIDYRGVLYAGCMLTPTGPQLIEYNVRFGDPEAEVVLPRLGGDVAALLRSVAEGQLAGPATLLHHAAVCIVLACDGYPTSPRSGDVMEGLDEASALERVMVFHAGTRRTDSDALVTAGGRVLAVTAVGADVDDARVQAYRAVEKISFDGMQFRHDIALLADHNGGVSNERQTEKVN